MHDAAFGLKETEGNERKGIFSLYLKVGSTNPFVQLKPIFQILINKYNKDTKT